MTRRAFLFRGRIVKRPSRGEWIAALSPFCAVGVLWAAAYLRVKGPMLNASFIPPLMAAFLLVAVPAAAGGAIGGWMTEGTVSDRLAKAVVWSIASSFISFVLLAMTAV